MAFEWTWDTPTLKTDTDYLKASKQAGLSARAKLERRITDNLIRFLDSEGFRLCGLFDGEEEIAVTDRIEALELAFNLDDCQLTFESRGEQDVVLLIFGNGTDVISDYTCRDTRTGKTFDKLMDAFQDLIEQREGLNEY